MRCQDCYNYQNEKCIVLKQHISYLERRNQCACVAFIDINAIPTYYSDGVNKTRLSFNKSYSYSSCNERQKELEDLRNKLSNKMFELMNDPKVCEFKTIYDELNKVEQELKLFDTTKIY